MQEHNCVYATLDTCYSVWMTGMQEHNCFHATHVACYSVWMTVWYAGAHANTHLLK